MSHLKINQVFHLVEPKDKKSVIRLPLPDGVKYNSEKFILTDHEVRQFLEPLGPFAMASIAKPARATEIIEQGFEYNKQQWHVAGGFIRDDGSVFVLLPEKIESAELFKRLGLNINLPKWADSFKVGKYLKRLWSHHRTYVQGDVIQEHNDWIMVKLDNGKTITIRYAKKSQLTEGMNLVSKRCLKMLGLHAQHGMGLRITALSPRGFTKGHAIVLEHLKYDLVMYETKDLLKSNGRFTFAFDELHPGRLYTDAQSVANFQMYNTTFMDDWSETFMKQVIENMEDEEKLRRMLRFYEIGFHKPTFHPGEMLKPGDDTRGAYFDKEKDWALLRAMRAGLPIEEIPAMLRKILRLFFHQVMNIEKKQRIPVQPEVGDARYILVDPTIFDVWGDPSLPGELKDNQVFVKGHTGPVVFHRQPNAHRGEHHVADSVQTPELEKMDTGCFMFISRDVVVPVLAKLGGGDQDDRICFYKDARVVDHFRQLKPYPLKTDVKKPEIPTTPNRFAVGRMRMPRYDLQQLKIILAQQLKQRVSIGQAVNPIIMDTVISDQQDVIINYLSELKSKDVKINNALEEMRKFTGFKMAGVASQLESIIDAVKRDGADVTLVSKDIQNFWAWLPVTPRVFLKGGEFNGRLPQSRRGDKLPVIVTTHLDIVVDRIKMMRNELEEYAHMHAWEVVGDIPMALTTYPDAPGDEALARAIRAEYAVLREEHMTPVSNRENDDDGEAIGKAFMIVDEKLYNRFKNHPLIIPAMVKLYMMIYSRRASEAPRDENGNVKPYPDGILWGPYMGGLTIKALDAAGWTCRYEEVDLEPSCKSLKHKDVNILVDQDCLVSVDGELVGMLDKQLAQGQTEMESGMVKVKVEVDQPQYNVLTVVNGLATNHATNEEIARWKSHVHEEVTLTPGVWLNPETNVEEHAVYVYLKDGERFGSITRRDNTRVLTQTTGWLAPAKDNHSKTLTVVVKA